MVKIKTTKIFDLPELIKWVWLNDKFGRTYHSNNDSYIRFDSYGDVVSVYEIEKHDLFNVEIEEEITEETEVPRLLEVYSDCNDGVTAYTTRNECIAYNRDSHSIAFHMVNPDGTTTLLWTKDGGMVE